MRFLAPLTYLVCLIWAFPAAAESSETRLADSYEVRFEPSGPDLPLRLPSAAGHIPLTPAEMSSLSGLDHLQGRLHLGPDREGGGRLLAVARKARGKPYALLFLDRNLDGALDQEEMISARPKRSREGIRSQFETSVRVLHGQDGESTWEDYPIRFWVVVDDRGRTPAFLHAGPRGARAARLDLNGFFYDVAVADIDHDGVFGTGDRWTLRPALSATPAGSSWRRLNDFTWARGVAWKLELQGTSGNRGHLVLHDPGITPSEDAARRDPRRADRLATRATRPIAFATEVEAAIAEAAARGVPYFLNFGASWCLPCRQMDEIVYTAEDVAAAARDVVCIKVDGDSQNGLERRHRVKGYPTGILLAPNGTEIARFQGYRGVEQMAAFFRQARP
ncbi:MAG: thioredoxin family protein [Thermoanaerobaculia bacterium]